MYHGRSSTRSTNEAEKSLLKAIKNGTNKSKRMVYPNAMLCHVWANQGQEEGRNGTGVLYFRGERIYSFGSHYLAAKIYTKKDGTKFAVMNSYRYSMETGSHLNTIESALRNLMPYYSMPNPEVIDCEKNLNYFVNEVVECTSDIFSTRKKVYESSNWQLSRLQESLKELNDYLKLIGKKAEVLPQTFWDFAKEAYAYKKQNQKDREAKNNTPEMLEKKQARKIKEAKEVLNELTERYESHVKAFRDFKIGSIGRFFLSYKESQKYQRATGEQFPELDKYNLLRVNEEKSIVETSAGAEVPLDHALRLLGMILKNKAKAGERIGMFTLESIANDPQGDKTIKIGCHKILLSEAVAVLSPFLKS